MPKFRFEIQMYDQGTKYKDGNPAFFIEMVGHGTRIRTDEMRGKDVGKLYKKLEKFCINELKKYQ